MTTLINKFLKKIVALNKVVGPGGLEPPTNGL